MLSTLLNVNCQGDIEDEKSDIDCQPALQCANLCKRFLGSSTVPPDRQNSPTQEASTSHCMALDISGDLKMYALVLAARYITLVSSGVQMSW